MNHLLNITSLPVPGVINTPQAGATSLGNPDLAGFLSQLVQQADSQSGPTTQATESLPVNITDLAAEIAVLLQTGADFCGDDEIEPAPASGLVTQLFLQIQGQPLVASDAVYQENTDIPEENESVPTSDLVEYPSVSSPDQLPLHGMCLHRAVTEMPLKELFQSPALLQTLRDKTAQLQPADGEVNQDALVRLKADIIRLLKGQGFSQPDIEHFLLSLAKLPKPGDAAPGQQADPPITVAAVARPVVQQPSAPPAAPIDAALSRQMAPHALQAPLPADGAEDNPLAGPPKPDLQQRMTMPSLDQEDAAAPRQQPTPVTAAQAPAPQPTPDVKINGINAGPNIINALADGNGSFSPDGFDSGSRSQPQDLPDGIGLLKPAGVDALNTQNFTNYLTAARSLPGAVTQMVSLQLQRNVNAKINTLTLQLHPAELGQMEIRLKFAKDGSIRAHMTVEKPETLALLQGDSYQLEKILQQAGLEAKENSLSFDLRQQNQHHHLEGFKGGSKGAEDEFASRLNGLTDEKTLQAKIAVPAAGYITQNGVNIIV